MTAPCRVLDAGQRGAKVVGQFAGEGDAHRQDTVGDAARRLRTPREAHFLSDHFACRRRGREQEDKVVTRFEMRLNRFRPRLADDQAVLVAEDPMACRREAAIEFAGERLVELGASFVADEYRRHAGLSERRKGSSTILS